MHETNLLSILMLKKLQTNFFLQALTHASYTLNKITESCERLEFLGDAVLDYLVICYLVTKNQNLTPGQITDMKSALVNNNNLADIAVRNGLHKHLLQQSPELFRRYTFKIIFVSITSKIFLQAQKIKGVDSLWGDCTFKKGCSEINLFCPLLTFLHYMY